MSRNKLSVRFYHRFTSGKVLVPFSLYFLSFFFLHMHDSSLISRQIRDNSRLFCHSRDTACGVLDNSNLSIVALFSFSVVCTLNIAANESGLRRYWFDFVFNLISQARMSSSLCWFPFRRQFLHNICHCLLGVTKETKVCKDRLRLSRCSLSVCETFSFHVSFVWNLVSVLFITSTYVSFVRFINSLTRLSEIAWFLKCPSSWPCCSGALRQAFAVLRKL